jgi:thiosulfate/3-mercaptopyruvate sulfurtransferase
MAEINGTLISAQDCKDSLDQEPVILDCRFQLMNTDAGRLSYEISHIPTAQYVHLDEDCSGSITEKTGRHPLPELSVFLQKVASWGITSNSQVILYDDQSGAIAARVWWMLRSIGVQNTAILDGGFPYWQRLSFPVTREITPPSSAALLETHSNWQIMTTEQIRKIIRNPDYLLVDARAEDRYKGIIEPIDPVAGHIPSAINRFHGLNFKSNGCFKSAETLRQEYFDLLSGYSPSQTIVYCGSGVTSCVDLLAMEIAGLPGAALYAGSWSEWIRDPENPISKCD